MTRKILEAVDDAREFFEIEDYPGDFFLAWIKWIIQISMVFFCLRKI